MLSPPVPIPASSYFLAYHLKSRDASSAPYALRASSARNRQISNGRLYLPLLYFRCNCFRVFTNARHRAHSGATFMILFSCEFFHSPDSILCRLRRRGAKGADYNKMPPASTAKSRYPLPVSRYLPASRLPILVSVSTNDTKRAAASARLLAAAFKLVSQEGFEPPTHRLEGGCSVRLSY